MVRNHTHLATTVDNDNDSSALHRITRSLETSLSILTVKYINQHFAQRFKRYLGSVIKINRH
ncbi:hypothetical protein C9J38_18605 [Photobacterium sp. GB-210]|nr:hypothetical protein C9J38_18605 [Photobacterium sp. GB-210]